MKFTVVIPTYNRIEKLENCILSILGNDYEEGIKIYVLADNNDLATKSHIDRHFYYDERVECFVMKEHLFVGGSWNWFAQNHFNKIGDIFIGLVDDVEIDKICLSRLVDDFKTHFPDTDGVVGIRQRCPGDNSNNGLHGTPYGQVGMGKKFIERYPNHQICCPSYIHFYQDEEMYLYAKSINKFYFSENADLTHYHPSHIKEYLDSTHKIPRGLPKKHDDSVYKERKDKGLIWGQTFTLIPEHAKQKQKVLEQL